MILRALTGRARFEPAWLMAGVILGGLAWAPVAGFAQEAQPEASPATPAPADPNIELRAKLDELRSSNDAFEGRLELLKQLLTLNVCDPQTKAKIEELVASGRRASAEGGETLSDTASATPISLEQWADESIKPLSRSEISKALQAMTVFVLTENSFGSGVIVGPNRVLTNRHVTESAGQYGIWVLQASLSAPIEAKVVAVSPSSNFNEQDFALLSLAASVPSLGVAIAPSQEPLETVYAAGFPNSIVSNDAGLMSLLNSGSGQMPSPVLSAGAITTIQQNGGIPMIAHSADISPGSSGGPLANACGELVGINTFITDGGGGAAGKFAISAAVARDFLSQNGVAIPVGAPCVMGAN
jgi:S1-C subfamily serine protease